MKISILNIFKNNLFSIKEKIFRLAFFMSSFSVFILSVYAPFIQHLNGYPNGESVYSLLSNLCHQYPLRSFWIFDRPFALCARCTSIYFGISFGALFIAINKKYLFRFFLGILIILFIAIDPVLQLFGFYESTNLIRTITGLIIGVGFFLLLIRLIK